MLVANEILDRAHNKALDLEPEESAQLAGLRYVRADDLSIERKKVGRGFSYFDGSGDRITNEIELERLKSLVIVIKNIVKHYTTFLTLPGVPLAGQTTIMPPTPRRHGF